MLKTALIFVSLLAAATNSAAQTIDCNLDQSLPGLVTGSCTGFGEDSPIVLRPMSGSQTDWQGAIVIGSTPRIVEIIHSPSEPNFDYIFRSNIDWFYISQWNPASDPAKLSFELTDVVRPSQVDVEILQGARTRLLEASVWDKEDDRNCDNDQPNSIGLYCALIESTQNSMGQYFHRQPALQFVRAEIQENWPERIQGHRLMSFNNHPSTTLEDVTLMLDRAIAKAAEGK